MKEINKSKHDVFCTYVKSPEHAMPGHPESPDRICGLEAWLETPPYPEIVWLDAAPAADEAILRVHQPVLLADLREESRQGPHEFEPSPSYITPESLQAAYHAAGGTLAVSRKILEKGRGRGFAIVRPPGHHAEADLSMGFCLLNNIAIAAADALARGLRRVAIFDFDAHHGNGTAEIFWDAPDAAYFSIHESQIYPGSGGLLDAPHARGRILNAPLPHLAGGEAINQVVRAVAEPWLRHFQPEMLFVSAGYDAHFSDPLTSLRMDTRGFYTLSRQLVDLAEAYCQGRILFALEGGYDPVAVKEGIQASLAALSDHETYPDYSDRMSEEPISVEPLIQTLLREHALSVKER